jgi:hypothetical protein
MMLDIIGTLITVGMIIQIVHLFDDDARNDKLNRRLDELKAMIEQLKKERPCDPS